MDVYVFIKLILNAYFQFVYGIKTRSVIYFFRHNPSKEEGWIFYDYNTYVYRQHLFTRKTGDTGCKTTVLAARMTASHFISELAAFLFYFFNNNCINELASKMYLFADIGIQHFILNLNKFNSSLFL